MHSSLRRALASCCLLLVGLSHPVAPAQAAPLAPDRVEWIPTPAEAECGTAPVPTRSPSASREGPAPVLGPTATTAYPMYAWPLARQMHDGLIVVNYVDDDPGGGVIDYMGGTATYGGHTGTDFKLYNFRLMDRGCTIRASTPGTVVQVSGPAHYDRHCNTISAPVNSILLDTGAGTLTDYYHLRANSMTVQVGEQVQTGQILGLVGSSGQSRGAHLHLQPWDNIGGSHYRDPYSGPNNPLPTLWIDPQDYDGDNLLWYTDLGVFSAAEVGGNLANTSYCHTMERLQQPVVYGIGEVKLPVFVQFQSRGGDPGRIEVRRPNGTLFASYDFTSTKEQLGFFWVSWNWSGNVSAADYGTWTVSTFTNSVPMISTAFQVGPATVFGPRFWPRSGRSFRINGAIQRDTLRHSPLGGPVTYSLIDAPAFVTLTQDSIITIPATSTQANRSLFFRALMTDGAARKDTAWFHLVDMSKPHGFPVDVGPAPALLDLELALAGPSPFTGGTSLRYRLGTPARVWLSIYDLRGRRVRTLVDGELAPAGASVTRSWDGRDGAGLALPGGVYFARLDAGGARRVLKIARLP